jgi:FkbM family methyltransferase
VILLMKLNYFRRFRGALGRILVWRMISALGVEAFHRIPGARFRTYLEPRFRRVGSLAVYSLGLNYEEALTMLPALLGPGESFLDCGANQGVYALYASDLVGPTGRVVAIEPQAYAARAIRLSAAANDFHYLSVRQAAVSDQDGEAAFEIGDAPVAARLSGPSADGILVETVRLDTALDDFGGRRLHVLKLDVEGAEELALRGAARLLAEHQPHVIFEAYNLDDPSTRGVYERLADAGYRFYLPQKGKLIALHDERRESFSVLAVHPTRKAKLAELIQGEPTQAASPARFAPARPGFEPRPAPH